MGIYLTRSPNNTIQNNIFAYQENGIGTSGRTHIQGIANCGVQLRVQAQRGETWGSPNPHDLCGTWIHGLSTQRQVITVCETTSPCIDAGATLPYCNNTTGALRDRRVRAMTSARTKPAEPHGRLQSHCRWTPAGPGMGLGHTASRHAQSRMAGHIGCLIWFEYCLRKLIYPRPTPPANSHKAQYQRLAAMRGKGRVAVAVGRTIIEIVYHLLKEGQLTRVGRRPF